MAYEKFESWDSLIDAVVERVRATKYNNVFVSSSGRVYNQQGKELKVYPNSQGYLRVELWKRGKRKRLFVHRLVAETFIPNPQSLPVVNHIDGNRQNNKVDNLEWCTHSENNKHASRILGRQRGFKSRPIFDLTACRSFPTMGAAAESVGVSQSTLSTDMMRGCKCRGHRFVYDDKPRDMEELIQRVVYWGEDRGIDNVKAQALCWAEECGETFQEINHDRFDDAYEDSLGDALVCEIILAHITKKSLFECLEKAYNEIKDRKGKTSEGHFIKES